MPKYRVHFVTKAEIVVEIEAPDEESAADEAWPTAEEYLNTLSPDSRGTAIYASLDGIGADDVEMAAP